jgi:hypothetical protein
LRKITFSSTPSDAAPVIVLPRRVRVDQEIERFLWRAVDIAAAAAHLPAPWIPALAGMTGPIAQPAASLNKSP